MDLWSLFKIILILSFLAGLMYLTLFFLKKYFYQTDGKKSRFAKINVVSVQMIMPKKFIAIVQVQDRTLALGITDHAVNVLCELDEISTDAANLTPQTDSAAFPSTFFEQFKKNLGMK